MTGVYEASVLNSCHTCGSQKAQLWRSGQGADFGGIAVKQLQAFDTAGIKFVVDAFGEIAADFVFAETEARSLFAGDLIEA